MTLRRDFMAFTAGAVVGKTVLPIGAQAASLDAELLDACAKFDRLEDEFQALHVGVTTIEDEERIAGAVAALTAQVDAATDAICATRVQTLSGAQALARSILHNDGAELERAAAGGTVLERLVYLLVTDLAAGVLA